MLLLATASLVVAGSATLFIGNETMPKKMDRPTQDRNRPPPSKLTPPTLPKIVPRPRLFRELD